MEASSLEAQHMLSSLMRSAMFRGLQALAYSISIHLNSASSCRVVGRNPSSKSAEGTSTVP